MPPRKSHLDELDYQIIRHLHANARISATEIARRTGSNERTIRKRIDHLVEDGVFRLTAIIEPQYFGYINTA
ncbi:MAG: AsnC family transcriptional regulator, partial [Anaerolineae bacterium]|nr:AsnC family transcriptional regulator [Anaerolineae bacterium]